MNLSDADKRELLTVARASIAAAFRGKPAAFIPREGVLGLRSGVFVTLRIDGELRGCVGYIEPQYPLAQAVAEAAPKAAFEDPRFDPLNENELTRTDIEISILSAAEQVSGPSEIEVGTHGLIVEAGMHRGLLLPQVATEYHWTREEFLSHTCQKAGLAPTAWRSGSVQISKFFAEKFSESDFVQHAH